MFNVWQFFPGYSVSLFHKISCGHPLLNRYCIYFSTAHAATICAYTVFWQIFLFKSYCNFKGAHAPYIWVVALLFKEATCRDLVFSRVLSFFEISTCNCLCFQRYWVNSLPVARAVVATNSFKFAVFFQNRRSCSKEIP